MKVILINKPSDPFGHFINFTIGKIYDIDMRDMYFAIHDDNGDRINLSHYFLLSEFVSLESYRNKKIEQCLK